LTRGVFVTFEGPEGAGKTTQIGRLGRLLDRRGIAHVVTREPGGTDLADRIRALLLDDANSGMHTRTEVLLMLAARSEHVENKIRPALVEGKVVLCDRFTDSTLAYQGYGRKEDLAVLRTMNAYATGGLSPDLTLVFDLPVEVGFARVRKGREGLDRFEQAGRDFHEAVRRCFLDLVEAEPGRVKLIDASAPEDEVAAVVASVVLPLLARKGISLG